MKLFPKILLLAALASALLVGCDQEETCQRTCERWVHECSRWNWDDCWDDCMADEYSRTYANCIQDAPCGSLDAVCDL